MAKKVKVDPKLAGDFGEVLVTFLLTQIGVEALIVGGANKPYDIIVPFPKKPFKKPSAISVKLRDRFKGDVGFDKEPLSKIMREMKKKKWELWLAYVYYNLNNNKLWFEIGIVNSNKIRKKDYTGDGSLKIENLKKYVPKELMFKSI